MHSPRSLFSLFAVLALACGAAHAQRTLSVAPAAAVANEQRVALVIGNATYKEAPLRNPVNDATDMAAELKQMGFSVTLRTNSGPREMRAAIREFSQSLRKGGVGLFYFAGHGVQAKGRNYLIPVNADIREEFELEDEAVDANRVLAGMEEAGNRVNIVILDACRNNPFARSWRSAASGLAQMSAPAGSFVAFATAPGSVAADGSGRNGLFTENLLRSLREPDSDIDRVFTRVTAGVARTTANKQVPWKSSSLTGEFRFRGGEQVASAAPSASTAAPQAFDSSANDRAFWDSVKDTRSADELRAYLKRFPDGLFVDLAHARLRALGVQSAPVAPAAQVASAAPTTAAIQQAAPAGSIASMARGTVFRDCADCPEMVVIPPGSFTMGSPESEPQRMDEGPQHTVTISKPFAAGKFELTFDEWDACVREGGCSHKPDDRGWGRGKRPVINVSWQDAKAYTAWLSRKTGRTYRLLTEAEWEYAARSGTTTAFYFGNTITPQQANYDPRSAYAGGPVGTHRGQTSAVGSYAANAFGLYDMHGNAAEWTEDCWYPGYKGATSDGSARVGGDCTLRAQRGGSWFGDPRHVRSAYRERSLVERRDQWTGFRIAKIDEASSAVSSASVQVASAAISSAETRPSAAPGTIAAMTRGTVFRDCDVCPEMVVIPPGSFTMGSPASEARRDSSEGPQHTVTIARPFAAGKFELTFDEWDACVGESGCSHRPGDEGWGRGKRPVINVSWEDAKAYTEWLSRKTGKAYRLLSEAQWEYIARAGTITAFSFGNSISPQQANYDSKVSYAGSSTAASAGRTVPVGGYPANAFGLHDVHGNVWEWTEDCLHGDYNGASADGSAWSRGDCSWRMLRGGNWDNDPRFLRSAVRFWSPASRRISFYGFRVSRID